jgi:ketosteroid isomerase-like protein
VTPGELAAREAIRDLVARYNASGDAGRLDPLLELFAEDALLEVPGASLRGRGEIRAFFEGVVRGEGGRRRVAHLRHFTATHQIDLEGPDRARGRCYYLVLTEAGLDHWGRYLDEYRRSGERWLFARRSVSVDGSVPGSWARSGGQAPRDT